MLAQLHLTDQYFLLYGMTGARRMSEDWNVLDGERLTELPVEGEKGWEDNVVRGMFNC